MLAPRSSEENNLLWQIGDTVSISYLWIACNDMDIEGDWRCEGHKKGEIFIGWETGEPNDFNNEDCAFMNIVSSTGI